MSMMTVYIVPTTVLADKAVYNDFFESMELAHLHIHTSSEITGPVSTIVAMGFDKGKLRTEWDVLYNVDVSNKKCVDTALKYVSDNLPNEVEFYEEFWK